MPQLEEEDAASIPHCLSHWLPFIDLLLCVYPGSIWVPENTIVIGDAWDHSLTLNKDSQIWKRISSSVALAWNNGSEEYSVFTDVDHSPVACHCNACGLRY